jgi:tryptophan synthase alpha chain
MMAAPGLRLTEVFDRLRAEGRPGLITYVTAGDPDLARSAEILRALDRCGADVIEVGAPFSDPLADGPVIQRAIQRALAAGATLPAALDLIGAVRADVRAPIVVFTYANPLLRMGPGAFAARAAEAGVDGVLALDLPIEEAGEVHAALEAAGIAMIFLLSPTTTQARIARAAALGRGFLYVISRLGVTGARDEVAEGARSLVERIRRETHLPTAVGFGVSHADHVAEIGRWADAAVVGSALVSVIEAHRDSPRLVGEVESFVRRLTAGAAASAGSGGRPA